MHSTRIYRQPLEEVWREVVAEVGPGDFLFIDSTHVGKIGSDVLIELHEMVPRLPAGVHVHFHDIFFPFEYPPSWVYDGRYSNEAYLLRSLLTDRPPTEDHVVEQLHGHLSRPSRLGLLPGWDRNNGGSISLRTVG